MRNIAIFFCFLLWVNTAFASGAVEWQIQKKESEGTALLDYIYNKYNNIITWRKVQNSGDTDKIRPSNRLPLKILETIHDLNLNLTLNDKLIIRGDSFYTILDSEDDIMEVFVGNSIVGYIFNIAECTPEECYGWDALYLKPDGTIAYKTF